MAAIVFRRPELWLSNRCKQTAETPLERWPQGEHGKALQQALETCVKAMNDAEAPATVRAALIKAAEEAGIGTGE